MSVQLDLFGAPSRMPPALPSGFRYRPDIITPAEEGNLLAAISGLPFREFEFHGYTGKRRVVSYGWRYDFEDRALHAADAIPAFLLPLREAAARFAGVDADRLRQALVSEYAAGAGIGWHRDKAVFGRIVGVSLRAPCVLRLRRAQDKGWQRARLIVAPRSAYVLAGEARAAWEHSIPPVDALRYSVTFRTLCEDDSGAAPEPRRRRPTPTLA